MYHIHVAQTVVLPKGHPNKPVLSKPPQVEDILLSAAAVCYCEKGSEWKNANLQPGMDILMDLLELYEFNSPMQHCSEPFFPGLNLFVSLLG